jgi:putative ABC transport system substrate-binding protein
MPVIGFLGTRSPEDSVHLLVAFRRGLGEGGFVEGQKVPIEFRWARGQYDRLPAMAADLVSRAVAVLVASLARPGFNVFATSRLPTR